MVKQSLLALTLLVGPCASDESPVRRATRLFLRPDGSAL